MNLINIALALQVAKKNPKRNETRKYSQTEHSQEINFHKILEAILSSLKKEIYYIQL